MKTKCTELPLYKEIRKEIDKICCNRHQNYRIHFNKQNFMNKRMLQIIVHKTIVNDIQNYMLTKSDDFVPVMWESLKELNNKSMF